jgi:integrase
MVQNERVAMVTTENAIIRNKIVNLSKIIHGQADTSDVVSYLTPGDIKLMVIVAGQNKRLQNGQRNAVLIKVLFDGCLRISEALGLRPCDIIKNADGYLLVVMGKGHKPGQVAISASTVADLKSYCYDFSIGQTDLIFNISRSQAFREIETVYRASGVRQPSKLTDRVGAVHVLRHSGCLARLALSGSPKEVQEQLRHKSSQMTLRYMKTLSHLQAMKNQETINVWE